MRLPSFVLADGEFVSRSWRELRTRLLVTAAVALVVAAIGGRVLDRRIAHVYSGSMFGSLNVAVSLPPDVLIVGASTALHAYDDRALTASLGRRVYNAGSDGRGILLGRGILALVCKKSRLSAVVVDVRENTNELARTEPTLAPFLDESPVIREILDHDWKNRILFPVHLLRYNGSALAALTNLRASAADRAFGFVPLDRQYDPARDAPARVSVSAYEDPTWFKSEVTGLVRDAQECGAKVLFLQSAVAAPGAEQPHVAALFRDVAQSTGTPYIEVSSALPKDRAPALFADADHLNVRGARLATDLLARELRSRLGDR